MFCCPGSTDQTAGDLLRSLVVNANKLVASFNPLSICQALYGLSVLLPDLPERDAFVRLLAAVAKQQLPGFSTQGISVLFVSLARLNYM